jgi:signal transduction histidine kinase
MSVPGRRRRDKTGRSVRTTRRGAPGPASSALQAGLLDLEAQYAGILGLLDRAAVARRTVAAVPGLTGVDLAWLGEPIAEDRMVLQHAVNSTTGLVDGLVVPVGAGLGGKVLATRRPLWVSDYCRCEDISAHFKTRARVEGIRAMIAVPVIAGSRLLGVLYGANRGDAAFGDRAVRTFKQIADRMAIAQHAADRARHAAEVAVHDERRRLALELHDTVGATLFTVGAGIRQLGAEPGLDHQVRSRLAYLEEQAIEAAATLRRSLRVLSTPPDDVALGVAVREHCRAFEDRTGIATRMIALTELPTMSASRVTALADAARESLLNVEKHAHAESVVATVFATGDRVAVTVSDDGVGLPDRTALEQGLGLAAMSEGLARVGGAMTVSNNDDGGVTTHAWVPL